MHPKPITMAPEDSDTGDGDNDNRSTHDQDLVWGCGLAVFGNILIGCSLNLQKYVHVRNSNRETTTQKHYTRDLLWWLGMGLMVFGEGCNFTAYGFAPASLVAPLGTTTVIANLLIAALVLKEKVKGENLFGCALAVIGAIVLVTFSSQDEKIEGSYDLIKSLSQPVFVGYVIVEITIIVSLLVVLHYCQNTHVVIYLLISSITASFTVISAKAVSGMLLLSLSGFPQWSEPILYAMLLLLVVTALIQIKYLNLAMKNNNATIVVPINFVIYTASAICAGIVFYKEFLGMTDVQIVMFLFGCVLSFLAVYFITLTKTDKKSGKLLEQHQQVSTDLVPSWMKADVNVGQVQPQGHVDHLQTVTGDDGGDGDDAARSQREVSGPVQGNPDNENTTTEGAVGGVSPDQLSMTSMDMLLDRERMDTYGATATAKGGNTS